MKKGLAWLVVFMMVLFSGLTAVGVGEISEEGTFQNDFLMGRLIGVDEAGNRTYHVTVDSSAKDVYGNPLTARDYGCVLLLTKQSTLIKLVSEMQFIMTVRPDMNLENELMVVSHSMLGLDVLNGKDGLYLEGDIDQALVKFGEIADVGVVQLSEPVVPLSAGSDEEDVQTPGEGEELLVFEPAMKRHDYKTIFVGDDFYIVVSGLSEGAYIQLPKGIGFDEDKNLKSSSARNKENLSYDERNDGSVREVHITPDAPEADYYILLTAEEPGKARLALRNEADDESIANVLELTVKSPEDEDAEEDTVAAPVIELVMEYEGESISEGTMVTITAIISGLPEDARYALQWQNDLSGEFADVPGEMGASVIFEANEENVNCAWRVALTLFAVEAE